MNAEELRNQAKELETKAAELEREQREQQREEERRARLAASIAFHEVVDAKIVDALATKNITAKVDHISSYQTNNEQTWPVIVVEGEGWRRLILVERYQDNGARVTVGNYGERPQTWTATVGTGIPVENVPLPYDKIAASVGRRLAKIAEKNSARTRAQEAAKKRAAITAVNEALASQLAKEFVGFGMTFVASEEKAGDVYLRFSSGFISSDVVRKIAASFKSALEAIRSENKQ